MSNRRPMIAGNWKMNGLRQDGQALAKTLAEKLPVGNTAGFDMLVCPPFPLLGHIEAALSGSAIMLGGQDCHMRDKGAFTGDTSPAMLKDAGCSHVILGHSERRHGHGESSELINAKATAAHTHGLVVVLCVGETEKERDEQRAQAVVEQQLMESIPASATAENTIIAYEPVWAIGTGRNASVEDISDMHAFIRKTIASRMDAAKARLLYGGSVKPSNARETLSLEDVDGVLVGGASLVAEDFWAIATASI
ncbi:MAG TPA: triose-phosphate isomerase [Rhodospirillaceae bacterium]|nr:MAG: triose-phosphate isomerase [Alphaproteobacteria bacterium GWF2_58_20]HAU28500.1 triose-phosphate isomerase [Rhodospirillaceae bacterium]